MASRSRIVIFYTVCTVGVLLMMMSLRAIYPDTFDGQTSKKGSKMVTEVAEHTVQSTNASRWLRSEWWKIHIQTTCKALRKTIQVGSVDGIQANMLVDDDHKILMCRIPKAASKTLTKIFAVLTGAFRGSDPEDIPSRQVYTKYRPLLKQFQKLPYDAVLYRVMNYFRFLFVREPFERLLSAFRDKLIEPPHGYFGRFGKSIIKSYRKNKTITGPIKFSEFVAYLVDPKRRIDYDNHFRPYYELCRPCDVNYDFLGKLETLGDDLSYIFEMYNLTGQVVLPVGNKAFQSFYQTDLYLGKYYSQVPKELLWKLYEVYYPDLLLFNYSVPDVIKRLLM